MVVHSLVGTVGCIVEKLEVASVVYSKLDIMFRECCYMLLRLEDIWYYTMHEQAQPGVIPLLPLKSITKKESGVIT